jgi:hypothetical protein
MSNTTYFHDFQNAWLVGNNGIIMRYFNPLVRVPNEQEPDLEDDIVIFPNPAEDRVCFKLIEEVEQVQIFDIGGKLILSQKQKKIEEIEVGHLKTGVYLINLHFTDKVRSLKLIKK